MSDFRVKLRSSLDRALADANESGIGDIDGVTERFRQRFGATIAGLRERNPEAAARLQSEFENTISEFLLDNSVAEKPLDVSWDAPAGTAPPVSATSSMSAEPVIGRRSSAKMFLAGVAATLLTVAAGYFVIRSTGAIGLRDPAQVVIPAADVEKARPIVAETISFLKSLQSRLEQDPESVSVADSKRFQALADAWPEQYQSLSKDVRQQVRFAIRRTGGAYKVLAASEICPLVAVIEPGMVDPRRDGNYEILCSNNAVWNEAGKNF